MKKLLLVAVFGAMTSWLNAQIVITEIMYNDPSTTAAGDSLEYIEIYNNSSAPVGLLNWSFSRGATMTFPDTTIQANSYLVVARRASAIRQFFGFTPIVWATGQNLINTGEPIVLVDNNRIVIDSVSYFATAAWPAAANGGGASMVLCDPNADNNLPASWAASTQSTGLSILNTVIKGSPNTADALCLPSIKFSVAQDSIGEPFGPAQILVTVQNADPSQSYSVDVDLLTTGTAVFGVDFVFAAPYNVTFPVGGPYSQFVPVAIIDDAVAEPNKTANFSLINPSTNAGLGQAAFTLVIMDDDNPPAQPVTGLVITEINYNPPGAVDSLEFVEIYNNTSAAIDLNGVNFTAGLVFTFPTDTIQPGQYRVVAASAAAMQRHFGIIAYEYAASQSLLNTGEALILRDGLSNIIDSVQYGVANPWPNTANGRGASLVLCDYSANNNVSTAWLASTQTTNLTITAGGGPGGGQTVTVTCSPGARDNACLAATLPQLSFESVGQSVTESVGNVAVSIRIVRASAVSATSAVLQLVTGPGAGTAAQGTDFNYTTPVTITFPAGDTTAQIVNIPIVDDNVIEAAENFQVSLSNATGGATIATPNRHAIVILDDDARSVSGLVITEIMYNNPSVDSLEFIELYNTNGSDVDISGCNFTGPFAYTFPTGTTITANNYIVIAANSAAMLRQFGVTALQWRAGTTLNNTGSALLLRDALSNTIDSVVYASTAPWPTAANGQGSSLALCDYASDNSLASNWQASAQPTNVTITNIAVKCSPMRRDSACNISGIFGIDAPASLSVFPNPSQGVFSINGLETGDQIMVTDMLGRQIITLTAFNGLETLILENAAHGLYIVSVHREGVLVSMGKLTIDN